jgi:hypothetical protein
MPHQLVVVVDARPYVLETIDFVALTSGRLHFEPAHLGVLRVGIAEVPERRVSHARTVVLQPHVQNA